MRSAAREATPRIAAQIGPIAAPVTGVTRALGLASAGIIAFVASLRCLAQVVEKRVLDVDPMLDPEPLAAISAAGSLALDVALLVASAGAFFWVHRSGRRINWLWYLLAVVPAPWILVHASADLGHFWRESTWLAGMLAAVAAAHLGRDRELRWLMIATALAATGPMAARGLWQVWVEHAGTVAMFEENKAQILADRGWSPGSPSALIYERRLKQPEPVGWFGLANVYASVMVTMAVMLGGLTLASLRARLPSGWTGLVGLGAAAALAAVTSQILAGGSASKGAAGAFVAGLLVVGFLVVPFLRRRTHWLPIIGLALVALSLGAVVLRGLLADHLGEKSLLFRWFYLQGAVDIVRAHPWTGVGAAGFQEAFMLVRPPRCPEEPASAHSMFVDWLAAFGAAGAAWVGLVALMLVTRLRAAAAPAVGDSDVAPQRIGALCAVVVMLTVSAAVAGCAIEWRLLDGSALLIRIAGVAGGVGIAVGAIRVLSAIGGGTERIILAAGVVTLLCHSQIEMTFWLPGSTVLALMLTGVSASGVEEGRRRAVHSVARAWAAAALGLTPAVAALALASAVLAYGVVPATWFERHLTSAMAPLVELARDRRVLERASMTPGYWELSSEEQQRILAQHGAFAAQIRRIQREATDGQRGLMMDKERQVRMDAATEILGVTGARDLTYEGFPLERQRVEAAMDVVRRMPSNTTPPLGEAEEFVYDVAQSAVAGAPGFSSSLSAAGALDALARAAGGDAHGRVRIARWESVTQLDPANWMWRFRLAEALYDDRQFEAAAAQYSRALQLNESFSLDPLKQMNEQQRAHARARSAAASTRPSDVPQESP